MYKFRSKTSICRKGKMEIGFVFAGVLVAVFFMLIWTDRAHAQLTCTFEQITNSSGGENARPSINPDGTLIAFESEVDLVPMINPDLNLEILLFDTTSGVTQITNSLNGVDDPSISSDGTRITFSSAGELVPPGNSDINDEVFLFDTNINTLTQVTDTIGGSTDNFQPSLNSDGTLIAFGSDADLVPMSNTDGNGEIFLAECPLDDDGDGVPNEDDDYPNSDTSPTVVIDGCDSGAENDADSNGCTISDLIAEIAAGSANHGQFARGVASLTNNLKKAGVITESEKDAIQDCAGQADIP